MEIYLNIFILYGLTWFVREFIADVMAVPENEEIFREISNSE